MGLQCAALLAILFLKSLQAQGLDAPAAGLLALVEATVPRCSTP